MKQIREHFSNCCFIIYFILFIGICMVVSAQESAPPLLQTDTEPQPDTTKQEENREPLETCKYWYILLAVDNYSNGVSDTDTTARTAIQNFKASIQKEPYKVPGDHIFTVTAKDNPQNGPIMTDILDVFTKDKSLDTVKQFLAEVKDDDTVVIYVAGTGGYVVLNKIDQRTADLFFPLDYDNIAHKLFLVKNQFYLWLQNALLKKNAGVVMIYNVERERLYGLKLRPEQLASPNNLKYAEIRLPEPYPSESSTNRCKDFGDLLINSLGQKKTRISEIMELCNKNSIIVESPKGFENAGIAPQSIAPAPVIKPTDSGEPAITSISQPLPETPVEFTLFTDKAPDGNFISNIPGTILEADFNKIFIGGGINGNIEFIDKKTKKMSRIMPAIISGTVTSIAAAEDGIWWLTENPRQLLHYYYLKGGQKGELYSVDIGKYGDVNRIGYSRNLLGLFSNNSTILIDTQYYKEKSDDRLRLIVQDAYTYLMSGKNNSTFVITVSDNIVKTYRHDAPQVSEQIQEQLPEWLLIPSMQIETSSTIKQISQNSSCIGVFTNSDIAIISINEIGPAVTDAQMFDTKKYGRIVEGSMYGDRDAWLITSYRNTETDEGNRLFHVNIDDGEVTEETAYIENAFKSTTITKVTIKKNKSKNSNNILKLHPGIRHVSAVKNGCYLATDKGVVLIPLPRSRQITESQ